MTWTPRRAAGAAALVALAAGLPAVNRLLVGVFYDDGLYAGLATALARGQGYVHLHLPGAPAAVHYPPLYPLVLAPLFGLLPVDGAALGGKIVNLLLGAAAAAIVTFHATRRRLLGEHAPAWVPALVVAAAATAIPVLTVQAVLFAEPLFGLLLALAVLAADGPSAATGPRRAVVAGVLAALVLLCRSIGLAGALGVVAFLAAVRRSPRAALAAAVPPLVAGAAWAAWVATHRHGIDPALASNYGSYTVTLGQAGLATVGAGLRDLGRPLAAITLGWLPGGVVRSVVGSAALAVGAYGVAVLARRSSAGLTVAAYGAIVALWPYPPDRFLWAILPWLALAWGAGAAALWAHRPTRVAVAALGAVLVIGYAQYQARGLAGRWWEVTARAISANFAELLPALRDLPADAVVATDDEALVWLYTGRRAVPLYLFAYRGATVESPDERAQRGYLARQGVTHVLLASATGESARALRALLRADPDWLVPVRRWDGGRWLFAVATTADEP